MLPEPLWRKGGLSVITGRWVGCVGGVGVGNVRILVVWGGRVAVGCVVVAVGVVLV